MQCKIHYLVFCQIGKSHMYCFIFCRSTQSNNMLCPNKQETINKLISANNGRRCATQKLCSHCVIVDFISASHPIPNHFFLHLIVCLKTCIFVIYKIALRFPLKTDHSPPDNTSDACRDGALSIGDQLIAITVRRLLGGAPSKGQLFL